MKAPTRNFILRDASGIREAETLVIGRGATVRNTAGGLPELVGARVGEVQLYPSGGDDTRAIRDALATINQVRLGPGTFRVSGSITLGVGTSIVGSGAQVTTVLGSHAGTIFSLGPWAGVEALAVRGPGANVPNTRGILANSSSGNVFVRDVRVESVQAAMVINAGHAEISNVFVGGVETGLQLAGSGSVVRDFRVQGAAFTALSVTGEACSCTGIRVEDCLADGIAIGGKSNQLAGARVLRCGNALTITGQGVAVDAVTVGACTRGILVSGAQRVVLDGVSVLNTPNPLAVTGSRAVAASAFHSDLRQTSVDAPHVVVSTSGLVTLVSFFRINPTAVVLTYEADVSAAGARVLFVQHDLDTTKVNSGGNFAEL